MPGLRRVLIDRHVGIVKQRIRVVRIAPGTNVPVVHRSTCVTRITLLYHGSHIHSESGLFVSPVHQAGELWCNVVAGAVSGVVHRFGANGGAKARIIQRSCGNDVDGGTNPAGSDVGLTGFIHLNGANTV